MSKLINYYILHKSSGISYDPTYISTNGKIMTAISNKATGNKDVVINVHKLIVGLKENRYRLIAKTI
jgi:hypothetical protein